MPIPRIVANLNRFTFNPVMRRVAGKVAPTALLIHHGRASGKEYRTPIFAFPAEDGFVIALTYGRNTDWERNVFNEGGCELVYRNERHALTAPHLIDKGEAERYLPHPIRSILRLAGVRDFLRLARAHNGGGEPTPA